MKILIITELLSPYRVDWFNKLGEKSEVSVLYTKDKEKSRNNVWLNSRTPNFKCIKLNSAFGEKLDLCFEVFKYLKGNYDVIVVDGYGPLTSALSILYLKISKKNFFMNIDGGFVKEDERFFNRILKQILISSPTYYLCSSQNTANYLNYYGAKKDNMFYHPFTSLWKEDILSEPLKISDKKQLRDKYDLRGEKIVIAVGRFIPSKGFELLINVWKDINPNFDLIIIGGGEEEEMYKELIKKLNLENVEILGFMEKEKLFDYYKASDLFVLPTKEDVWGLVINEALANGLPVVTTNRCVAGLELIENFENGFIVPVDDHKEITKKINYILNDEDLRYKMSVKSLINVKEYYIENMASIHLSYFKKIQENSKE